MHIITEWNDVKNNNTSEIQKWTTAFSKELESLKKEDLTIADTIVQNEALQMYQMYGACLPHLHKHKNLGKCIPKSDLIQIHDIIGEAIQN